LSYSRKIEMNTRLDPKAQQTESPTAQVAAIVAGATSSSLDERAIAAAQLLIADGIAVAVAGSVEDGGNNGVNALPYSNPTASASALAA
jgi:hypothetical protein